MAAPTLNSHATANNSPSSTTGVTATLPTYSAGDVIVAEFWAGTFGTPATVSSVTGGGLTWTKRFSHPVTLSTLNMVLERWYAVAGSGGTNMAINATYTQNVIRNFCNVTSWTGCHTAAPWDPNGSLPVFTDYNNAINTSSHNTGPWSTTNANDVIYPGIFDATGNAGPAGSADSGYTKIEDAANQFSVVTEYKGVTAVQTSITLSVYGAFNDAYWVTVVDALTADSAADNTTIAMTLPTLTMALSASVEKIGIDMTLPGIVMALAACPDTATSTIVMTLFPPAMALAAAESFPATIAMTMPGLTMCLNAFQQTEAGNPAFNSWWFSAP